MREEVYGGIDAAPKRDSNGVVFVRKTGAGLTLALHKIWRPTPGHPMDFEATIEAYVRHVRENCRILALYVDPFQMHSTITRLAADQVPIVEFPQTVANTTRMGQVLFDLLEGRNLTLYPSAELREQALNAVAIESPRGFRIAKEKASKKIDAIVALAMACVAALDAPVHATVSPASITAWGAATVNFTRKSDWREYR
jgi:phage terminase large subunit-like protein